VPATTSQLIEMPCRDVIPNSTVVWQEEKSALLCLPRLKERIPHCARNDSKNTFSAVSQDWRRSAPQD